MATTPIFEPPATLDRRLLTYLNTVPDSDRQELLDLFLDAADYCPRLNTRTATDRRAALILRRFRELVIVRSSWQAAHAGLKTRSVSYGSMLAFSRVYRLGGLDFARWAHSERFDPAEWDAENLPTSWQKDAPVNNRGAA